MYRTARPFLLCLRTTVRTWVPTFSSWRRHYSRRWRLWILPGNTRKKSYMGHLRISRRGYSASCIVWITVEEAGRIGISSAKKHNAFFTPNSKKLRIKSQAVSDFFGTSWVSCLRLRQVRESTSQVLIASESLRRWSLWSIVWETDLPCYSNWTPMHSSSSTWCFESSKIWWNRLTSIA